MTALTGYIKKDLLKSNKNPKINSMQNPNLANLTTQYQQAYLIYCYKIMQYLQALAWLAAQKAPQNQANIAKVKPKSASGVKKLAQRSNQEKSTFKSLKHQEKPDVSTIVAMGFPNGAMSAAFRVAFNEFGGKFERLNDAFADQRKGPIEGDHFYSLSTDVCATSDQFCGTSLIGALSDSESVPFEDHRVGRIDILGVDPIRHSHGVNNDGSVWMLNVALDGHRFGGQVLHTVREINGHVNLTTVGSGFGPFPRENEVLGSALFLKMHFNVLRRYGEARQLMQKRQRSK